MIKYYIKENKVRIKILNYDLTLGQHLLNDYDPDYQNLIYGITNPEIYLKAKEGKLEIHPLSNDDIENLSEEEKKDYSNSLSILNGYLKKVEESLKLNEPT